ncbi:MAG TPA: hypothetical protein ENL35_03015, partial [Chloroflexi bacterium]|nr:hypothetical protein [Chloroflexota bacterium]
MIALGRALAAEALKLKRTLALRLAFIIPPVIPLLYLVNYWQRGQFILGPIDVNPWLWMTQKVFILWTLFLLPLFIALETAFLGGPEHSSGAWKHLFALPIPRWAIYDAKLLVAKALIAVSTLVLCTSDIVMGLILRTFKPGIGFEAPIPWGRLGAYALRVYLASCLMITIHTWIALRWSNFALALGVGIGATFAGLISTNTRLRGLYP